MHQVTDLLAIWGAFALLVVIVAAGRAVRKLRAAKAHLEKTRAGYNTAAGSRSAGEAATPSTYTIPEGPRT